MFRPWNNLATFQTVGDVLADVGISDEAWNGWLHHIGPLGNDLRVLAALPAVAVVAAVGQTIKADGAPLNPVEATQVGLCWRTARRVTAMNSGMDEAQFIDVDPWALKKREVLLRWQSQGLRELKNMCSKWLH